LAATNTPWAVAVAFRRPGRFNRTLLAPPAEPRVPSSDPREPAQGPTDRARADASFIAEGTYGFSGADLSGLVETAVERAIDESSEDSTTPRLLATRHTMSVDVTRFQIAGCPDSSRTSSTCIIAIEMRAVGHII
jgi:SpoVK/Ycf46/Vps4 family AAA+-type ATPase